MATKITLRTINALKSKAEREGRPLKKWEKGFGVRVAPSGEVSWMVQKWQGGRGGKSQSYNFKANTIDEARAEADRLIGQVRSGIDLPNRRREKRKAKREALNASKLGEAVDLYLKRHSKPGSYWSEIKRKFDVDVLPALGSDALLADITKADVRALIEAKHDQDKHGSARYLFAALRPFFKWCAERDLILKSPLEDMSPPKPLPSRDRVLTDAEIATFWKASEADALFGPFYRLLLLTAQRREEVGGMQWQEVAREAATWTIPKSRTKNAKEHVVHLSPQALAVLETLPQQTKGFVFTTTGTTPISGYGKAKERLDAAMGDLPEWRVHDLRRTAASGMAALGFQPHIIERVLNHISGATGGLVGIYQRFDYLEERKRALEAWANHVESICLGCPENSNVQRVKFRR